MIPKPDEDDLDAMRGDAWTKVMRAGDEAGLQIESIQVLAQLIDDAAQMNDRVFRIVKISEGVMAIMVSQGQK